MVKYNMKITRTITAEVEHCGQCPFFASSMDGPYCIEMVEKNDDPYTAFIYPEGRDEIHPDCPFLDKNV